MDHYARAFSEALGRTIRYRDMPTSEWIEKLRAAGLSEHVVHQLTVMTELHKQGRYDRMSEDYLKAHPRGADEAEHAEGGSSRRPPALEEPFWGPLHHPWGENSCRSSAASTL